MNSVRLFAAAKVYRREVLVVIFIVVVLLHFLLFDVWRKFVLFIISLVACTGCVSNGK